MDFPQKGLGFPKLYQDHQILIGYIVVNGYRMLRGTGIKILPQPRTDHTTHYSRYSDVGFIAPDLDLSPQVLVEISGIRKSASTCRSRIYKYAEEYTRKHYVFSELFHWHLIRDQIDLYLFDSQGNYELIEFDDFSRYLGIHLRQLGQPPDS